jgi:ADP-ribose pyrophosphatase YjhB (NUDIX family)
MAENRFVADIPHKAIVKNNGKVLIVQNSDSNLWEFPGGRLLDGEKSADRLKRSLQEKMNAYVEPLIIFETFPFVSLNGEKHFSVIYICKLMNDPESLSPNGSKIKDFKWIAEKDVDDYPMHLGYKNILKKYFESALD